MLNGCSRTNEIQSTYWAGIDLQGKTLDLIDDRTVETYRFSEKGFAVGTFGIKEGPLTGPGLYWKMRGDQLLISEEQDGPSVEELSSPEIVDDVITAKRKNGSIARYRISK